MLLLSMEKSTQSRTAITPFAAFLMGDRLPYVWGGYNDLVFFVSALSGQLTSQGVASLGAFPAFKNAPEASLDVFSTFGSTPEASPACFQTSGVLPKPRSTRFRVSGVLPRLPRRIFNPQKYSRGFRRSAAHCLPSFLRKLARYFCRKALPCDKSTFNSIQTKIIRN